MLDDLMALAKLRDFYHEAAHQALVESARQHHAQRTATSATYTWRFFLWRRRTNTLALSPRVEREIRELLARQEQNERLRRA